MYPFGILLGGAQRTINKPLQTFTNLYKLLEIFNDFSKVGRESESQMLIKMPVLARKFEIIRVAKDVRTTGYE